jgi:hypothetical protein
MQNNQSFIIFNVFQHGLPDHNKGKRVKMQLSGEKRDAKVQEVKNNKSTIQTYQRDFQGVYHSSEEDKKFLLPYSLGALQKALSDKK